jgi:hypothetical protein
MNARGQKVSSVAGVSGLAVDGDGGDAALVDEVVSEGINGCEGSGN